MDKQEKLWGEKKVKHYSALGVVVSPPQESVSKAGKTMCQFVLQELKGGAVKRVIALKMLNEVRQLSVGMKLSLNGTLTDDGDGVFLSFFTSASIGVKKTISPAAAKQNQEELEAYYSKHNLVKTKTGWAKKEDTVETSAGVYEQRIEFIMNVLGPGKVTELLRTKLKEVGTGLVMNKNQAREMKNYINELIEQNRF